MLRFSLIRRIFAFHYTPHAAFADYYATPPLRVRYAISLSLLRCHDASSPLLPPFH